MAKLSQYIPFLLLLVDAIQNAKAKKIMQAVPLVHEIRARFRLAFIQGAGVTISPEEVQQLGGVLKLGE